MRILAFETSCDETGVAVVEDGRRIRANVVATQLVHQQTGGIVPEVASRSHLTQLRPLIEHALKTAGVHLHEMDAFAATSGPGLATSLMIGASAAKGLAVATGIQKSIPPRTSPPE